MTIYSGFSHWKWWFSIAMLVYQRVYFMEKNPDTSRTAATNWDSHLGWGRPGDRMGNSPSSMKPVRKNIWFLSWSDIFPHWIKSNNKIHWNKLVDPHTIPIIIMGLISSKMLKLEGVFVSNRSVTHLQSWWIFACHPRFKWHLNPEYLWMSEASQAVF